jgi:hypothetical protein
MVAKEKENSIDPLEENQDQGVTVKLGKTHFDWLQKASKKRFGLPNQAGLVRLLIHEKWEAEKHAAAGAPPAPAQPSS